DDVGGVQFQRVKVVWGADGVGNDTSAANPLPVVQTGALPAGTNAIGTLAPGTNTIGYVSAQPKTTGGLSVARVVSAASTNATVVKASAGQVYGWFLSNTNAAARYCKIYNKATAPTVGTDVPILTLLIPAGGAANTEFSNGIAFATGIGLALTTGATDADTAAVAANECIDNTLFFKPMPASYVGQVAFGNTNVSGTTWTVTASANTTAGNLLVVVANGVQAASNPVTITDSQGNTWTK